MPEINHRTPATIREGIFVLDPDLTIIILPVL
jgi:hypothetical protein